MKKIVLFASGSGTNVQNIAENLARESTVQIAAVFCNNPKAFVIERCRLLGIPCIIFNRDDFYHSTQVLQLLRAFETDLIVLAGFLWLVPQNLVAAYPHRILNIHPALLPKHGGKGMYGMHVHQAVIDKKETESGITIHTVDEEYDKGHIVFAAKVDVEPTDTAESLSQKIHALEYQYFPQVIKEYAEKLAD